jgi:hypothetical protein
VEFTGRVHQDLGGHASGSGAGGPEGSRIDDEISIGLLLNAAQRGKARASRADDDDLGLLFHGFSLLEIECFSGNDFS